MDLSFFAHPSTDPRMNSILISMLQGLTQQDVRAGITNGSAGHIVPSDVIAFAPETATATAYATVKFTGGILILIQGIQSAQVANQLIPGSFGGVDIQSTSGAHMVFYLAAVNLINNITGLYGFAGLKVFVAGHSFGGATAEVVSYLVQSQGLSDGPRCWSFGSPRPGVQRFAGLMRSIDNTRWMKVLDVVPHLPPNSTDDLSIAAILTVGQLRLANGMVQPPYGYVVDSIQGIFPASNNSARLDFLGFTIFGLPFAVQFGDTNVSHTLSAYYASMVGNIAPYIPPTRPAVPNPEIPIAQTTRQRDVVVAQAMAVVRADATAPGGLTRSYVVPPVQLPSAPRYHARKDGKLWTIQLAGIIVGIGTSKREAKSVARKWNRAARATLIL